jgi:threonine-phosphate decarboxylase
MLSGHGDDIYGDKDIKANFSTNIYYKSNNSWLKEFLINNWKILGSYPEPDAYSLKESLAKYHNIKPNNFIIGNGATEIFYLIAQAFSQKDTLIPVPSFAEYKDACQSFKHSIINCQIEELEKAKDEYDLIIICNPNNPNGHIYSIDEIERIIQKHKKAHLLIDEAFIDFIEENISAINLIQKYPNLLICKSMTKDYAIPGLRLGYLMGQVDIIEKIERYKQPWSVNALAIEAGKYALKNCQKTLPNAKELRSERIVFQKQLDRIEGFKCLATHAPFFLVKTIFNSTKLKDFLVKEKGILIRDASNFESLDNHYFRLNTLDTKRNNMLIKALQEYAS